MTMRVPRLGLRLTHVFEDLTVLENSQKSSHCTFQMTEARSAEVAMSLILSGAREAEDRPSEASLIFFFFRFSKQRV